jgi:hypothetical protein
MQGAVLYGPGDLRFEEPQLQTLKPGFGKQNTRRSPRVSALAFGDHDGPPFASFASIVREGAKNVVPVCATE